MLRLTCLLAMTIAVVGAAGPSPQPAAGTIAIRAARWLDPVAGRLNGPAVVVVRQGRIDAIAPPGGFDPSTVSSVIDLGDATLLPGLIDAHVHLQLGGPHPANAEAVLNAGFTTVVDLGARSDAVLRLRDEVNAGRVAGPRILAAGRWIGTKNGVCEFGGIGVTGGPPAFRARVRDNIAAGADLIKVCVSGWPAEAIAQPDAYEIADADLSAVVDESHREKRLVIAHAISAGGVRAALQTRVDGLAHAALVDAATATQLRDRGVFVIPTLASLVSGGKPAVAERLRSAVATLHSSGVRLVFGTDGGVLPHGQNAREFSALVEAGIPAIEAIRAATANAAAALGLDSVGIIARGRSADLIAVDGDPVGDVASLSRVVFVMRNGVIVRRPAAR